MTDDLQTLLAGMVRPLEWAMDGLHIYLEAHHRFGSYEINDRGEHWSGAVENDRFILKGANFATRRFPTLEAAQSAAQADYTARIASALNPDAVLALVAAAYADAAEEIESMIGCDDIPGGNFAANTFDGGVSAAYEMVRHLTPTDATAALARMLEHARAEARSLSIQDHAKAIWENRPQLDDTAMSDAVDETDDGLWIDADRGACIRSQALENAFYAAIRAMKGEQG